MTRDAIANMIRTMIQPLARGKVNSVGDSGTVLDDLVPSGSGPGFQQTFPFGFVSSPPKGIFAYFLNLFGNSQASIILSHFHAGRPKPSAAGEVIVYCTNADGSSVPVKFTLGNDGILKVTASSKVQIQCDNVEVGQGTLEKVLNGETFQTFINEHVHIDSMGGSTQVPTVQSDPTHLSNKVKAAK